MDAFRKRSAFALLRDRSPRRRGALRAVPSCDTLEGRRLLSATPKSAAKAAAVSTPTPTTTTRTGLGTTFAADLALLRADDQAEIVDIEANVYDAQALQADLQTVQSEATETPTPAVKSAFIAQIEAAANGLNGATQTTQFENAFHAFLQGEGITDTALISKTIADQENLGRAQELPVNDVVRVVLDRHALANDLGIGAQTYTAITNAGPAAATSKTAASKALKSLVSTGATHPAATSAAAKAALAGKAKLTALHR